MAKKQIFKYKQLHYSVHCESTQINVQALSQEAADTIIKSYINRDNDEHLARKDTAYNNVNESQKTTTEWFDSIDTVGAVCDGVIIRYPRSTVTDSVVPGTKYVIEEKPNV